MLDQGVVSIITTIVAVTGAISGTMLGVILTHRAARKVDKSKVTREKIEELYILTNQIKIWYHEQIADLLKNNLINYQFEEDVFWILEQSTLKDFHKSPYFPINKVTMLINLYAPSLREIYLIYHLSIVNMQLIQQAVTKNVLEQNIDNLVHTAINNFESSSGNLLLFNLWFSLSKKMKNPKIVDRKVSKEAKELLDDFKIAYDESKSVSERVSSYIVFLSKIFKMYHEVIHSLFEESIWE
jgi:hypothetical protein